MVVPGLDEFRLSDDNTVGVGWRSASGAGRAGNFGSIRTFPAECLSWRSGRSSIHQSL